MRISYNKLWKMLIDKNMKKSDLKEKAGISSASLAKLGKGDNITTDVLLRICEAMDCRIEDIPAWRCFYVLLRSKHSDYW